MLLTTFQPLAIAATLGRQRFPQMLQHISLADRLGQCGNLMAGRFHFFRGAMGEGDNFTRG